MSLPLVIPGHYRIARREANNWHFKRVSVFYQPAHQPLIDPDRIEQHYGLTLGKVAIEFFRINGGHPGWYLANLRDRKYYYCGTSEDDVKAKLVELGFGVNEINDL